MCILMLNASGSSEEKVVRRHNGRKISTASTQIPSSVPSRMPTLTHEEEEPGPPSPSSPPQELLLAQSCGEAGDAAQEDQVYLVSTINTFIDLVPIPEPRPLARSITCPPDLHGEAGAADSPADAGAEVSRANSVARENSASFTVYDSTPSHYGASFTAYDSTPSHYGEPCSPCFGLSPNETEQRCNRCIVCGTVWPAPEPHHNGLRCDRRNKEGVIVCGGPLESIAKVWSTGSQKHAGKKCKPCAFFHTRGCTNGVKCTYCHLCSRSERKRRQKRWKRAQAVKNKRLADAGSLQ